MNNWSTELHENNNGRGVRLRKHLFRINGYSYQLELARTCRMEIRLKSVQIVDGKANNSRGCFYSNRQCVPLWWSSHKIVLYLHSTIFTWVIAENVSHCDGTHTKCRRYSHLTANVWVIVDHHVSHCDEVCSNCSIFASHNIHWSDSGLCVQLQWYPHQMWEVFASHC